MAYPTYPFPRNAKAGAQQHEGYIKARNVPLVPYTRLSTIGSADFSKKVPGGWISQTSLF